MNRYELGKIITTKKNHACGSNQWEVTRNGADVKIKCLKCNREIMMSKPELDKKIKNNPNILQK